MTRRLFSELQVRVDGVNAMPHRRDAVDAAVRASTRLGSAQRPCRDGVAPRRSKYFIFALYLPLFQLILDVFILNTQELVFGWKVYDYVSYQRYRFSVRDQRCVSRRPVVWRRLHAIFMNRLRERRFSRPFGPTSRLESVR